MIKSATKPHTNLLTIVKEGGINFSGTVLKLSFGLLTLPIITRYLTAEEYGLFTLGTTIIFILLPIAALGIPSAFSRYIPYYQAKKQTGKIVTLLSFGASINLGLSLGISIGLFLSADMLATSWFTNPQLAPILKWLAVTLPVLVLIKNINYTFIGFKELRYGVLMNQIYQPVTKAVLAISLFLLGFSLPGLVIAQIISVVTACLLGLWHFKTRLFNLLNVPRQAIKKAQILSFSWPLTFNEIVVIGLSYADIFMLGTLMTSQQVGIYQATYTLAGIINYIPISFWMIYKPIAASLFAQKKLLQLQSLFKTTNTWVLMINIPIWSMFIVFAKPTLGILFGSEYQAGAHLLQILATGFFINSMLSLVSSVLEASAKTKLILANSISISLTNIALNYILITNLGSGGAAAATVVSAIVMSLLGLFQVYRAFQIQPYSTNYIKLLMVSLACVGGLFIVATMVTPQTIVHLMITGLGFAITYYVIIWKTGFISRTEYTIASLIFKKIKNRI
jgi:O-antigen/teichoic acid export membrane protein